MTIIVASGGPDWASILTAFGTVAAAVAAVGIASWSARRGKVLIEDERQVAREREALAEAYRVQVIPAHMTADGPADRFGDPEGSVRQLAAMVVNHGNYTIMDLEAQFVFARRTGVVQPQRSVYVSGFDGLPGALRDGWAASEAFAMESVLTPRGTGIRYESPAVPVQALENPYPLVRWKDRWGTRWEHRLGEVRPVRNDEDWVP